MTSELIVHTNIRVMPLMRGTQLEKRNTNISKPIDFFRSLVTKIEKHKSLVAN